MKSKLSKQLTRACGTYVVEICADLFSVAVLVVISEMLKVGHIGAMTPDLIYLVFRISMLG